MFKQILSRIEKYDSVILLPHINPDGDALGSCFGLKHGLTELYPNKHFYIVGKHTSYTKWMGEFDEASDQLFEESLVISLDTNFQDRIYDPRWEKSQFVIHIDHHPESEHFGDIEWIDPTRSSTCTMITEFYYQNDKSLPKQAAECLFFGIVTDTQRFRTRQVDGKTHRMIGFLLDHGVDRQYVYDQFYLKSLPMLELEKFVLTNYQTTPNGFIYITLNKHQIEEIGCALDQASDSIMKLENIHAYPVWGAFYEDPEGVHARIRSRGPRIKEVLVKHGGNGHDYAAGTTLDSWVKIMPIVEEIDAIVKDYHKK